jgi:hypothetical protein
VNEVNGDCAYERYTLGLTTYNTTCPRDIRINQTAQIGFAGSGHSCDCDGYAETNVTFNTPSYGGWSSVDIAAEEVICDPSSCCDMCRCIDMYDVTVPVDFPAVGTYVIHVNGQVLCTTSVFGEDGCARWPAGWVSVDDFTELVFPPDDGGPANAVFNLSLSSGMCCSPSPIVTITSEQPRDPSSNVVNLTYPTIDMCEGDCCYECECLDSFRMEVRVGNLTPGTWTVCFERIGCYDVEVAGWI